MFHRLDDFFSAYAHRTKSTAGIFAQLSDANLGQRIAPGHRSLGDIGWHVVTSTAEMMARTGLRLTVVDAESLPPANARAIQDAYREVAEQLQSDLRRDWTDATLAETDDMYGERWPRGLTLAILIHHEIHHLGQMTVLLRQSGARVPGTLGPSLEEWAQYGMPAPKY